MSRSKRSPRTIRAVHEAAHALLAWVRRDPIGSISLAAGESFLPDEAMVAGGVVAAGHQGLDPAAEGRALSQFMICEAPRAAHALLTGGGRGRGRAADELDHQLALKLLARVSPPRPAPRSAVEWALASAAPDEHRLLAAAAERRTRRALSATQPNGCPHLMLLLELARRLCEVGSMTGAQAFTELDRLVREWPAWEGETVRWWGGRP